MPISPGVNLTANLETILGGSALQGFLRITLCGFGPVIPAVPGTCILANAGVPQLVGPAGTCTATLFGNDVITPANTFYEIAVLDPTQNVIQADNYQFLNAAGGVDLSQASPILPPYGFYLGNLSYLPCTGGGTAWVAPGISIAVDYNGVLMPYGLALPTLSYTLAGLNITLNFTPSASGKINALCIL